MSLHICLLFNHVVKYISWRLSVTSCKCSKNIDSFSFFVTFANPFTFNMKNYSQAIFEKNTVTFVTVATGFCEFLERAENMNRDVFVKATLQFLPLLYLEASMLPEVELFNDEEEPERYVTEEIYEVLRINLSEVLADKDDYLEVFLPDMAYSDTPIKQNISEDLADIYMDLRNFIFIFRQGLNETMNDALYICRENFSMYWGQKLVNTLRALHDVKYNPDAEDQGDDEY